MSFGGCRFPKEETLPLHGFAFSLEPRAIGVRPNSGTLGMEGVRIVCIVRRSSCGDSIFGCRQALQAQSPGSLQAPTRSLRRFSRLDSICNPWSVLLIIGFGDRFILANGARRNRESSEVIRRRDQPEPIRGWIYQDVRRRRCSGCSLGSTSHR